MSNIIWKLFDAPATCTHRALNNLLVLLLLLLCGMHNSADIITQLTDGECAICLYVIYKIMYLTVYVKIFDQINMYK